MREYLPKTMKRTPLRKNGKSKLAKAKQLALKYFSLYIRLRDCTDGEFGNCYTCGKQLHYKQGQCGHFMQGRHTATLFLEINSNMQCVQCNIFKHGNLVEYTVKMIEQYGIETVETLRDLNRQIEQFKTSDYLEVARVYRKKVEDL